MSKRRGNVIKCIPIRIYLQEIFILSCKYFYDIVSFLVGNCFYPDFWKGVTKTEEKHRHIVLEK